MNLVRNEQIKLTASYLNGLAIALFGIGGIAPTIAYVFGSVTSRTVSSVATAAVVCVVISATLHLTARRILRGLTE